MVALEFSRALLCLKGSDGRFCPECDSCRLFEAGTHPDCQFIGPEIEETEKSSRTRDIGISSVRRVIGWNKLKPILAPRKVAVINDAQRLSVEAQNAFLKSLEEPAGSTVFILIAPFCADLLETVVSRCRKIKFLPLDFKDFKKALGDFKAEPARLSELYAIYSGQPGPARLFAAPDSQREFDRRRAEFLGMFRQDLANRYRFSEGLARDEKAVFETVDLWRVLVRDLIFVKSGLSGALANSLIEPNIAEEARNHQLDKLVRIFKLLGRLSFSLKETNLNPRLALDWVMTEI
jgi:DNA polymerase-3 subunit delta'